MKFRNIQKGNSPFCSILATPVDRTFYIKLNLLKLEIQAKYKLFLILASSVVDENYLVRIKVKELTYVWYDKKNQFCKLAGIEKSVTKTDLHNLPGYSKYQQLIK